MARRKLSLIVDERHAFPARQGNGHLRRQVWVDAKGKVAKYSFAYINHHLCSADNGRVLGFDMAHGHHHEHRMGKVREIVFESFTTLEAQFEQEFRKYHEKAKAQHAKRR